MRRNLSESRVCPGIEIGINFMFNSRPTLDTPMAVVLSTLGQTSSLMRTAELGNLDNPEFSVYLNLSIHKAQNKLHEKSG